MPRPVYSWVPRSWPPVDHSSAVGPPPRTKKKPLQARPCGAGMLGVSAPTRVPVAKSVVHDRFVLTPGS